MPKLKTVKLLNLEGEDVTEQVREILIKFIQKVYKNVGNLTLSDLDINPFLLKMTCEALKLKNAEDIINFIVMNRFERSTSTSFGNTLQKIVTAFTEGTGVEGADILIKRNLGNGMVPFYTQLKSGPNTVNKDIALEINGKLQSAVRRHPGSAGLLGMCYGRKDRVSYIVGKYLSFESKIGREFWEFISGDPRCAEKIYIIVTEVITKYEDKKGRTLSGVLQETKERLIEEFAEIYDNGEESLWVNIFENNM